MTSLVGRVVLVTGALGHLGQVSARRFLRAGAKTVLVDRMTDRLDSQFQDVAGSPDHMLAGGVDLTDEASVVQMVREVVVRFGRIDVVVNTVGAYSGGMTVVQEDVDTWGRLWQINVMSTLLTSRAVIPGMVEQGRGAIVNVASHAALRGREGLAAYSMAKSAVLRLTESLSAEVKSSGVNVNAILPGTLDTPENRKALPGDAVDDWVTPEAVADVILFLSSDAARAIHGASIPV